MFDALSRYRKGRFVRYFASHRAAKVVTATLFVAALAFFALETFLFFRYGFRMIARDQFFGSALLLYVFELFFLATFLLVTASALTGAIFTLFGRREDEFLLVSPKFKAKVALSFLRTTALSSWPILLLVIPALAALHTVFPLDPIELLATLFGVLCYTAIAVASALVLVLGTARLLGIVSGFFKRNMLSRFSLAFCSVTAFALAIGAVYDRFHTLSLIRFFEARTLDIASPDLSLIASQFHLFPSHPLALLAVSAVLGNNTSVSGPEAVLLLFFLVALGALVVASRWYLSSAQALLERGGGNLPAHIDLVPSGLFGKMRGGYAALAAKEYSVFVRDGRGALWFFVVLLIWLFQVGSTHILAHNLEDERVATRLGSGVIEAIAFATIVYFASIIVLRFVFPAFSGERRTVWLLRGAPIDLFRSYLAKFTVFSAVIGSCALVFASMNLGSADIAFFPYGGILLILALIATMFLASLGLSLGAIFPNTETSDPELLSTTLPGLGFIAAALLYGLLGALAFRQLIAAGTVLPLGVFIVFSFFIPVVLALRSRAALLTPAE